jgi:hypothetical protein
MIGWFRVDVQRPPPHTERGDAVFSAPMVNVFLKNTAFSFYRNLPPLKRI